MSDINALYNNVCRHAKETATLASIEEMAGWDERTMMPVANAAHRAEQMTLLTGMVHQRQTDPRYGEWLDELSASPLASNSHTDTGATIYRLKRQYDKRVKLPKNLVEELTRTSVLGQQVWQTAREENDFASFRPLLEKTVQLKREEADSLGYPECRYDALLDDYEPDELTSNVTTVLAALREQLVPLVAAIADSGQKPDVSILHRNFPTDKQDAFGRKAASKIGFDFERGRLDVTTHPFCTGLGPNDCRITTRYDKQFFNAAFFGIMHEAGHGIYDQGLRTDQYGLPLGEAISLGIHESQSRLWENLVGRSRSFWNFFYPEATQHFPAALRNVSLDDFYFAINAVEPSLIRVEADEVTYNLHILIRFELEQALINDDLSVADLPDAWNDKYRQYLGVEPQSDTNGVLQDIHWSAGLIGYFPTYALGNLYASQFFATANAELGGLADQFSRGEFQPLRDWLREKIHSQGQRMSAAELVKSVTGSPLSHDALIRYLYAKLSPLYGLD